MVYGSTSVPHHKGVKYHYNQFRTVQSCIFPSWNFKKRAIPHLSTAGGGERAKNVGETLKLFMCLFFLLGQNETVS